MGVSSPGGCCPLGASQHPDALAERPAADPLHPLKAGCCQQSGFGRIASRQRRGRLAWPRTAIRAWTCWEEKGSQPAWDTPTNQPRSLRPACPGAGFEDYFPYVPNDLMAAGFLASNPDLVGAAFVGAAFVGFPSWVLLLWVLLGGCCTGWALLPRIRPHHQAALAVHVAAVESPSQRLASKQIGGDWAAGAAARMATRPRTLCPIVPSPPAGVQQH